LKEAEDILKDCTHRVVPARTIEGVCDDPDDNRVLECAVACGCECIVTGDNDLLRLGQFEGIEIVRLSDFLAREER
jgi:predicted nucleic acid-binding protein